MVKIFYKDVKCAAEDQREIGERFDIKTGVKEGCNMSGFLFLIAQRSAVSEEDGYVFDLASKSLNFCFFSSWFFHFFSMFS